MRYISTAMPLIEEVQDAVDDTEDVDVDDTVGHGKKPRFSNLTIFCPEFQSLYHDRDLKYNPAKGE